MKRCELPGSLHVELAAQGGVADRVPSVRSKYSLPRVGVLPPGGSEVLSSSDIVWKEGS